MLQYPAFRLATISYRPDGYSEPHTDGRPHLSIVLEGRLREWCQGREEDAGPGSLVLKAADARHSDRFGPRGARLLTFRFREAALQGINLPELESWRWAHGPGATAPALAVVEAVRRGAEEVALHEVLFELLAALPAGEKAAGPGAGPPSWLARLTERLHDEYAEPLLTQDLAGWLGLHPVYLARAFRRFHGCGVQDYLRELRLHRALRDIAGTAKPLARVALDHGFADQSHLTRLFSSRLGHSPWRFRRAWRGALPV